MPPASTVLNWGSPVNPHIGWQVRILPFTEQGPLYDRINMKSERASWEIIPLPKYPDARARHHQVPYAQCPDDDTPTYDLQWDGAGDDGSLSGIGSRSVFESGQGGTASDVYYVQGSYTGNMGTQLCTENPGSPNDCDQYITVDNNLGTGHVEREHGQENKGGNRLKSISGIFGEGVYDITTLGDIKDGTSNTFMAGELVGRCLRDGSGHAWWETFGYGNVGGQTATPLNILTTCVSSVEEAVKRQYIHPDCAAVAPWEQDNLSWGFRSFHPAGANFLMGDGSVQFINNDVNYQIYKAYGGRDDAQPVTE